MRQLLAYVLRVGAGGRVRWMGVPMGLIIGIAEHTRKWSQNRARRSPGALELLVYVVLHPDVLMGISLPQLNHMPGVRSEESCAPELESD